jgi:hypothetical protein
MQINSLILSSLTKGLIISAVLIFFHVYASQDESPGTNHEVFKIAADQAQQDHQNSETKIVVASLGIEPVGNFEVGRDILLLLVVFLTVDVLANYVDPRIPIPLSRYFKILLLFFISPNAPPGIIS